MLVNKKNAINVKGFLENFFKEFMVAFLIVKFVICFFYWHIPGPIEKPMGACCALKTKTKKHKPPKTPKGQNENAVHVDFLIICHGL